jgi:hypothetical protein
VCSSRGGHELSKTRGTELWNRPGGEMKGWLVVEGGRGETEREGVNSLEYRAHEGGVAPGR